MATYFQWIFQGFQTHIQDASPDIKATSSSSLPWYMIPPPKLLPTTSYNPTKFNVNDIFSIIINDIHNDVHFSTKMTNTGDEGLYGLFHYCQFPDIEIGFDLDIASFLAGAISCTLLGLYLDDIYKPRKLMAWWPTRWFFHFFEEGLYLGRSSRWFANALIIVARTFHRAIYGGMTHGISRLIYYWIRTRLFGATPYTTLADDTLSAFFAAYWWTAYTLESEKHTGYDRLICIGWSTAFTGLLECILQQYFLKNPPPGLFRWLFGGAFYGPGAWQYLQMGDDK